MIHNYNLHKMLPNVDSYWKLDPWLICHAWHNLQMNEWFLRLCQHSLNAFPFLSLIAITEIVNTRQHYCPCQCWENRHNNLTNIANVVSKHCDFTHHGCNDVTIYQHWKHSLNAVTDIANTCHLSKHSCKAFKYTANTASMPQPIQQTHVISVNIAASPLPTLQTQSQCLNQHSKHMSSQ